MKSWTYTSNKWWDQSNTGFSAGDSLAETEKEGEIAVDTIVTFEFPGSLDTFPCRRDFDQNTLFLDTNWIIEGNELLSLWDNTGVIFS